MKRILAVLIVTLISLTFLLSSCGNDEDRSSGTESESISSQAEGESSAVSEASSLAESSEAKPENRSGLELLYCAFSEKPYFALFGKCEDGATVFGESDDGFAFSTLSWHGWFALRLKCNGRTTDVTLYQQVDGTTVGEPYVYTARPLTPASDNEGVVTGNDFQFFYQKCLPDYLKTNVPQQSVLDSLTTRVKNRVEAIHEYNKKAEIIYMIVPASITVKTESVPDAYVSPEGDSRLDKVIAAVRAGGATAIDLREAFAEHKNDEMPLYYHLDSHWADYGGYIAYKELFDYISKRFPDAAPRGVDEFDWNPDWYESGDMPMYLSLPYEKIMDYGYYRKFNFDAPSSIASVARYRRETNLVYSNEVTYERYFQTDRKNLPSCVVYRDSFGTQVYDIIAERMNNTHYMGMWGYAWNNALIQSEQPDYIIYVVAEWNLDAIIYN